jgi:ATP-dependent DNA helicase RecG
MKTLGYVNQFGRGIETVNEELEANKNGLPEFKFDDITTFKAIVMNADPKLDNDGNGADNGAEKIKNGAESGIDGIGNGTENGIDGIEKVTDRVLALINEDNGISKKAIAEKLRIGTTTVSRHIKILKNKGVIKRAGGDKGGCWEIKQL